MPVVDDTPKPLKPYVAHGVELRWRPGEENAVGDCPFCGREGKLSLSQVDGLARCWACTINPDSPKGGVNALSFVRKLWERSHERTSLAEYAALAVERRLLSSDAPIAWELAKSFLTGEWLVPGFGPDGKLCQLYRWAKGKDGGRVLMATPGLPHGLLGFNLWDASKAGAHVCEGPWDGMAWWEVLRQAKRDEGGLGLRPTASEAASLGAGVNVVALPGCGAVGKPLERLAGPLAGKAVALLFDSDHPKPGPAGGTSEPAGFAAAKRAAALLGGLEKRPASVEFLQWGPDGYDPALKSGWDVRDALAAGGDELADRLPILADLLAAVKPVPGGWVPTGPDGRASGAGNKITPVPCRTWKRLRSSWQKALHWRQSMDDALSVMLAVAISTVQQGDQLFLQVIGDAGSGKTRFCDGMLVSHKCKVLEHVTGFHSGWKDGSGEKFSLLDRINGLTLITPEADVMMSSPAWKELMSQIRRIYDGSSGATYKNQAEDMVWRGLRTPWIMAGTPALLDGDQSRLGDRFLKVWIDPPTLEEKDEILETVGHAAWREVGMTSNCDPSSTLERDMLEAFQLTGGYVDWLREDASEKIRAVQADSDAAWVVGRCGKMADLVADLRARPNSDKERQEHNDTKELPTRLTKQFVRLACCLAVVLNRAKVDEDVLRRVRKVALDTGRGRTADVVRHLFLKGEAGAALETLAVLACETEGKEHKLLRFLRRIKVVELFNVESGGVVVGKRWRLTPRVRKLWEDVNA